MYYWINLSPVILIMTCLNLITIDYEQSK